MNGSSARLDWSLSSSYSQTVAGAAVAEVMPSLGWQLVQAVSWAWRIFVLLRVTSPCGLGFIEHGCCVPKRRAPAEQTTMCRWYLCLNNTC